VFILAVRVEDGTHDTDRGVGTNVQGARRGLPIRSDDGGSVQEAGCSCSVPGGRGLGPGVRVGREEASQLGLGGETGGASGPTWLGCGKRGEYGAGTVGPHDCAVEGEGMEPKREIVPTFDLKDFEIRPREDLDGIRRKI